MSKKHKLYGRVRLNKLDWLIAIAAIIIGVAALWICIGVSVRNAAAYVVPAFGDVALSLGCVADSSQFGQAAVLIAYNSIIFYGSLLTLFLGCIYLIKKDRKERIPGLVAEFVAAIGVMFYLSFIYEIMSGSSKGHVGLAFPIVLILFVLALGVVMVLGLIGAFSNCNIELEKKEDEVVIDVEQPEPEPEPEPVEEPQEEPEPEEEEEELEEEDEDEEDEDDEEEFEDDEESDEFNFKGLGKRRRRIPFEKKIARADADTKARYKAIVSRLRQFEFNDRKSIPGETFSYKRTKLVFLTFSGKTLKAYFRLDPNEFVDSPLPIKDASDVKKYEETPSYLKIKSDLASRRVIALGERLAQEHEVPEKK